MPSDMNKTKTINTDFDEPSNNIVSAKLPTRTFLISEKILNRDSPSPGAYDPRHPSISSGCPIAKIRPLVIENPRNKIPSTGISAFYRAQDTITRPKSVGNKPSKNIEIKVDFNYRFSNPGPGTYSPVLQRKDKLCPAVLRDRNPMRPRTTIDPRNLEVLESYLPDPCAKQLDVPYGSPPNLGPGSYFKDLLALGPRKRIPSGYLSPRVPDLKPMGFDSPGPARYQPRKTFNNSPVSSPSKYVKTDGDSAADAKKSRRRNASPAVDGTKTNKNLIALSKLPKGGLP